MEENGNFDIAADIAKTVSNIMAITTFAALVVGHAALPDASSSVSFCLTVGLASLVTAAGYLFQVRKGEGGFAPLGAAIWLLMAFSLLFDAIDRAVF